MCVCVQIISWWYSVRTSASHSSASGHTGRSNGQSEVAAHACASMCDEMVVLWRLAVLDPTMSPCRSASSRVWVGMLCHQFNVFCFGPMRCAVHSHDLHAI